MLHPHDEASLQWFFGEGSALFERSTTGAMIERQWLFHVPTLPDPELVLARKNREPWEEEPGALTAQPTAEVRSSSGYMAPEGAISRFARVSRILRSLEALDLAACAVLHAFYGDQGARWGRTSYGRLFALWPMTPAGDELLKLSREPGRGLDRGLAAAEQLWTLLEVHSIKPISTVSLLRARARTQAVRAYEQACILWAQARRNCDE